MFFKQRSLTWAFGTLCLELCLRPGYWRDLLDVADADICTSLVKVSPSRESCIWLKHWEAVLGPRLSNEVGVVRGTTDWIHLPWPGMMIITWAVSLTGGLSKARGASTETKWENSEGPKGGGDTSLQCVSCQLPRIFRAEILAERCAHQQQGPSVRLNTGQAKMTGQRQPRRYPYCHKTWDCHIAEPSSWFPTLLVSPCTPAQLNLSFVHMCVSCNNSSPGVKQESTPGPWKEPLFCSSLINTVWCRVMAQESGDAWSWPAVPLSKSSVLATAFFSTGPQLPYL